MRTDVAEAFMRMQRFEHRRIVAATFRTTELRFLSNHRPRIPAHGLRTTDHGTRRDRFTGFLPQPVHVHQPQPHPAIAFDAAGPIRHLYVDRREADAVALGILYERRRMIEPHRLVVEHRRVKRRGEMRLQIRARVDEQREARRVRLGKPVQRKRRDRSEDLFRRAAGDALPRHSIAQLPLDLLHAALGALEAERAPQLLRLTAAEPRRDHRHPQQLFLKQRNAERALEDRLQRRMRIRHGLVAAPPPQIGMHHVADDRSRPDDRHFDDDVVEGLRLEPRQRRHLRARLDLEDADRVGLLQHPVDGGIVGG